MALSTQSPTYEAIKPESLPLRMCHVPAIASRIGADPAAWTVREVGDGNLNLVFIVRGPLGALIVKQALPYVRLVGDSWPLPLYRSFFEYHALTRQAARDPGRVPAVVHFDEAQAIIAMEFLEPHRILRQKFIGGERVAQLGACLGVFCARTAFRGSELSMASPAKKADVALFSGNVEIPAITEALVFTDPYCDAPMNKHTSGLEPIVASLRADVGLKVRVQRMLQCFASSTETMLHGDLHSGSIMSTDSESRVIDPEFSQYGPMGFDIGMLIANYLMAYLSQPGHRGADLDSYQDWILSVIEESVGAFDTEFRHLWATERAGMLYPTKLFEAQGHDSAPACSAVLSGIWRDAWAFCGIEMHRRCLSLAHNADFEEIDDVALRARLEARNLMLGVTLIRQSDTISDAAAVCAIARDVNRRDYL